MASTLPMPTTLAELMKLNTLVLGGRSMQSALDLWLWEVLFCNIKFERFVELGTSYGGTSVFFLCHCLLRGKSFVTVDKAGQQWGPIETPLSKKLGLANHCLTLDVLGVEGGVADLLCSHLRGPGVSILFCDNGDKPREVARFAPLLKVGDILAVHDWGQEIDDARLAQIVYDDFEMIHVADEALEQQSFTRFWRRLRRSNERVAKPVDANQPKRRQSAQEIRAVLKSATEAADAHAQQQKKDKK